MKECTCGQMCSSLTFAGDGGLNKNPKTCQDSRSYGHDLNPGPSEHEV